MEHSTLINVLIAFVFLFGSFFLHAESDGHGESHGSHQEESEWKVMQAQKPAKASLVPKDLVLRIKKDWKEEKVEKKFLPSEVYLFDKNHHIFNPPLKIITPVGGGIVDLSRLLPEGKAKFSFRINLVDSSGHQVEPDHVYFVPHVSLRKEGKEINCGKYFDITHFFKSTLGSDDGFETYITDRIYGPNLIGSFIFVKNENEKTVQLSQVQIVDERLSTCQ